MRYKAEATGLVDRKGKVYPYKVLPLYFDQTSASLQIFVPCSQNENLYIRGLYLVYYTNTPSQWVELYVLHSPLGIFDRVRYAGQPTAPSSTVINREYNCEWPEAYSATLSLKSVRLNNGDCLGGFLVYANGLVAE